MNWPEAFAKAVDEFCLCLIVIYILHHMFRAFRGE